MCYVNSCKISRLFCIKINDRSHQIVEWTGTTVDMLNAMQQLLVGGSEYFDPVFVNTLGDCWDLTDPQLRTASDKAWQGFIDYFENDGYGVDAWGEYPWPSFVEYNPTVQDFHNILIHEPCNYASGDGRHRVEYFPVQYSATCLVSSSTA